MQVSSEEGGSALEKITFYPGVALRSSSMFALVAVECARHDPAGAGGNMPACSGVSVQLIAYASLP